MDNLKIHKGPVIIKENITDARAITETPFIVFLPISTDTGDKLLIYPHLDSLYEKKN